MLVKSTKLVKQLRNRSNRLRMMILESKQPLRCEINFQGQDTDPDATINDADEDAFEDIDNHLQISPKFTLARSSSKIDKLFNSFQTFLERIKFTKVAHQIKGTKN